ncbi:DUF4386 family protein [Flagellimonas meridianipacifica]|uniref:Uncharacterized protein DUF4386 n=1 Tax=Flagellimonas meridianipacifica TaxID=1080225 RepID=A0A2T0MBA0_9FLAO|nr:DUF4386 family protein [Allomuricauda pacifica]PRX54778.1 uncharacterized protein DUF4386 [Allomuricauda pacifica]
MTNNYFQKLGGLSAILEALIYISAFIVYGGILVYPSPGASLTSRYDFLSENYWILSILNLTSYVLFGILLAILVLALHQRISPFSPLLSKLASVFGVIWVGLVIASGMIANIGLEKVVDMGTESPERAMMIWSSIGIVTEGLGGGNEIVGGLWVLLLSLVTWKHKLFPRLLNFLGVFVGVAGVLTIYPLDTFKEIFGLSQIVWFIWIGMYMIRRPEPQMDNK